MKFKNILLIMKGKFILILIDKVCLAKKIFVG